MNTPKEFTPHIYQKPIMDQMKSKDYFGALAFPGSGKTVIALDAIYSYKDPTLIIAPLEIMYTTWLSEPSKWTFSKKLKVEILHGKDKVQAFHRKAGVYIINPEGIAWLVKEVQATGRFPWKNLIVDESTKFKNHKSVRFKSLLKIIKSFERRYILCGNPMPQGYLDLWSQIFLLDLGERLGSSWYSFREKYFYPTDYKRFHWALRPGAKETIVEKLNDIVYFLEPNDGALPERIIDDIQVKLPPKARKLYKQMEDNLFAILDLESSKNQTGNTDITAANRTSAMMKCWQIANGFVYENTEDQRRVAHSIHNELITRTIDLVESLQGAPILIAYHFKEDLCKLKAAFPSARIVGSGMKPADIKAAETDWNNNGIEILLAYVSKFSHGLNLQYGEGYHILFYCLTYNYDVYDQLIRRFQRQGAKFSTVVIHRLIAENTIHEAIIANLESKQTESEGFLDALKHYRIGRTGT